VKGFYKRLSSLRCLVCSIATGKVHSIYSILQICLSFAAGLFNGLLRRLTRVFCFCFVFLCLVLPNLPVSLECPFLIAPSVFSNVYFTKH
jgi:hypothetical protein